MLRVIFNDYDERDDSGRPCIDFVSLNEIGKNLGFVDWLRRKKLEVAARRRSKVALKERSLR